jgi:alpha/beta hydrolase fold
VTDSSRRMRAWLVAATRVAAAIAVAAAAGSGCSPAPFTGFRTTDGFGIAADLYVPPAAGEAGARPAPLVLAGHQLYRDRHSWDPLVPALTNLGFAVLTLDHRGFGESTAEAATPGDLSAFDRLEMYRDFTDGIAAAAADPRIDATRVAILASGVSVAPAVRAAEESGSVVALVLFPGLIDPGGVDYLLSRPDFPVLLISAMGEARGREMARQWANRFTGPAQEYLEFPPTGNDAADWEGTDGLGRPNGVLEAIVDFLERSLSAGGTRGGLVPLGR